LCRCLGLDGLSEHTKDLEYACAPVPSEVSELLWNKTRDFLLASGNCAASQPMQCDVDLDALLRGLSGAQVAAMEAFETCEAIPATPQQRCSLASDGSAVPMRLNYFDETDDDLNASWEDGLNGTISHWPTRTVFSPERGITVNGHEYILRMSESMKRLQAWVRVLVGACKKVCS